MSSVPVVLITGASSGLGELTATTLAQGGLRVFAAIRDPGGRGAEAAARFASLSSPVDVVALDVTDDDSVSEAVDAILAQTGRIDVVVNSAGTMSVGVSEAFTIQQAHDQFDVNVLGPLRVNRAVLPGMRAQGSGLLIQLSSLSGRVVWPFFGVYAASKYAVEALAESFRYELAPFGVDSVIVEPGPFPTNLIANRPQPTDTARVLDYGETAQIPGQMLSMIDSMFAGEDAAHPQLVADAIAGLIETPPGERPLRTVVGADFGVAELNKRIEPIANELLENMGLGHLVSIAQPVA